MDYFSILFHKKFDYAVPLDGKYYEALFAASSGGGWSETTITGTTPIYFKSNGDPLKDYHIFGETVQDGTPSPDYPVDVQGCGDKVVIYGLSQPLCSVSGYRDMLDLSTGTVTRRIKQIVLTGDESWNAMSSPAYTYTMQFEQPGTYSAMCTHFAYTTAAQYLTNGKFMLSGSDLALKYNSTTNVSMFKNWIAEQYANGTPVIVWYILAVPETETVAVPSGLSGIIYGDLTRSGTPSPTTPIYPISNGVKDLDGTYHVDTGIYKIPVTIGGTTTPIYIGSDPLYRVGEYADEIDFANQRLIRRIDPTTMQPYATPITSTITVPQLTAAFGDNTLTVDTTVKPSAMSVTGNIKPTGYGQLVDVNGVKILDKDSVPIYVHGQQ